MEEFISGGIINPYSKKAVLHAEKYYEEIRHFSTDYVSIAQNTGFSSEQILMVKHFLFIDEHVLGDKVKRFSPSFEIAESWRRLAFDPKNIKPHDIILIKHEMLEMKYIQQGMSQREAHIKTCELYDYLKESTKYYISLGHDPLKDEVYIKEDDFNSGGIAKNDKSIKWEERC